MQRILVGAKTRYPLTYHLPFPMLEKNRPGVTTVFEHTGSNRQPNGPHETCNQEFWAMFGKSVRGFLFDRARRESEPADAASDAAADEGTAGGENPDNFLLYCGVSLVLGDTRYVFRDHISAKCSW